VGECFKGVTAFFAREKDVGRDAKKAPRRGGCRNTVTETVLRYPQGERENDEIKKHREEYPSSVKKRSWREKSNHLRLLLEVSAKHRWHSGNDIILVCGNLERNFQ